MEQTLYWVFSTIPQTLGGALALMAAFIVPQLNAFNMLIHVDETACRLGSAR